MDFGEADLFVLLKFVKVWYTLILYEIENLKKKWFKTHVSQNMMVD